MSQDPASLARFSPTVRAWFARALGEPTPIQRCAWETIANGSNSLVIAPTGSGKTLAAFLFAIDRLMTQKAAVRREGARWKRGVRVLYVSPLKALGADVQRNLQVPLEGIAELAGEDGVALEVAQRTGDTTPDERRKIAKRPPDILITTPESLYLLLTSQARSILNAVETVIVDEVHALAGTKRGSHLSLSLERLDDGLARPAQRIGLSATVRPAERVAHFLGGPHPVEVVRAAGAPSFDLRVAVPVHDMTAVVARAQKPAKRRPVEEAWKSDRALRAAMAGPSVAPDTQVGSSSMWPAIEAAILAQVLAHRSTIVFVNSRGLCERLTGRLNELYAKRYAGQEGRPGDNPSGAAVPMRSSIGSTQELVADAEVVVAKAHHGSVSKERRLMVERELKLGQLPCVVATSSLELGIDMGSIDLVIQVAPPPSVSSGLQRVGRANHQVGGRSQGIVYPRTRTEIIDAAAVTEGMLSGAIEETRLVENALDVLAQQTVAAVAMEPQGLEASSWYATVRRSACYANLPQSAFDAVLAMLAGRFASGDLAEYAPRILWDEAAGLLKPRPSSQRLAVTAAGTIPDRGLYPAVLAQGDGQGGRRRVGELDEEMVHESRVGDVIILGASTWRIQEIANDRVIVEPAPGRLARLPFWHGDVAMRPFAAGCARGAFVREVCAGLRVATEGEDEGPSAWDSATEARLERAGLDENARANLASLLVAQRGATGVVPTDTMLVLEQCKDEVGDWRLILHTPFGRRVHEPWALAVAQRIERQWGFDPQVSAADDGIIVRVPLTQEALPGPELFRFEAEELEGLVRGAVDKTALFSARFRECAARALLMTPTAPGKRAPLWQQRLKGGQLLEAVRREPGFPLLLEAARECLCDVFDLPSLRMVMGRLATGAVRVVEATTSVPSPFAAPLIFGYVAEHLYEGDLPHAEARTSLLSLDPALLSELLGSADVADLLDPAVCVRVEEELQHLAPGYRVRGAEGVFDLLRQLGPLEPAQIAERLEEGDAASILEALACDRRAYATEVGGRMVWAAADDAQRLWRAVGAPTPPWLSAEKPLEPGTSVLDNLVARCARTHATVDGALVAAALGIGEALARDSLDRLVAEGRVMSLGLDAGWADAGVLRRLRALSLAAAREAVEPVGVSAYSRYLMAMQGLANGGALEGVAGVAEVLAQYEGAFFSMELWEQTVLPARVRGYRGAWLDDLVAQGDVLWVGREDERGQLEVAFYPADSPFAPLASRSVDDPDELGVFEPGEKPLTAEEDVEPVGAGALAAAVRTVLGREGSLSFGALVQEVGRVVGAAADDGAVAQALELLVRRGGASCDSLALVRAGGLGKLDTGATVSRGASGTGRSRVTSRRARASRVAMNQARAAAAERVGARYAANAALEGRWTLLVPAPVTPEEQAVALVESLLDRYGVVSGDIARAAGVAGGLNAIYPALRAMEDAGQIMRGAFVEGLGPAQFATRATIEALRGEGLESPGCCVLKAEDPACLYGTALPWPSDAGSRPRRAPGALVVLVDGVVTLYASAGLKVLTTFTDDAAVLERAVEALVSYERARVQREGAMAAARAKLLVETIDGVNALDAALGSALEAAGFVRLPNGLRLYVDVY